ncbi:hypothetical protein B0A48_08291 [Cryoendolithus antarcticus]|uniref:Uncharacterized protein n=1 Tax=Cryoendolithus antarcticus TaxID=1507870 RepID=A0A1V8T5J9_9PEZI|nr:hypothetical protein B0A48_08291 [Cryoendolithus antarcticus]
MFLSDKPGGCMLMQEVLGGNPVLLEINPMLMNTLSIFRRFEVKHSLTRDIELEHTFNAFPGIVPNLDQCLQTNAAWLENLISSLETTIFVKVDRSKKPDTQWATTIRYDFVVYGGESVGDFLRELRAQAAKIQDLPENILLVIPTLFSDCYERRLTKSDTIRRLMSISKGGFQGLMDALPAEGAISESEAQG